MNVNQLQQSYQSGDLTWTKHGPNGLAPRTEQYDLNGGAEHHITVNYGVDGNITGVHYTSRTDENGTFHLHYYADNGTYSMDLAGTRNPKTLDVTLIKTRLGSWCVASGYAVEAPNGQIKNWTALQGKIDQLEKDVPKARKTKRGTVLDITGGGARRY